MERPGCALLSSSQYPANERDMWHLPYPDFQRMVKVGKWSGANILVMPHLAIVLTEEREIC